MFGGTKDYEDLKKIGDELAAGMRQALDELVLPPVVDHYMVKDRKSMTVPVRADDYTTDGNVVSFWLDDNLAGVFFNPVAFWPVYADPDDEEE